MLQRLGISKVLCLLFGLMLSAGIIGCGGDDTQVEVFPASGTIMVGSQPAAHATIMLIPKDKSGELETLRPNGKANEQGQYTLSTYGINDGAPAGEYKVTIAWHGPPEGFDVENLSEEELTSGPDRLGGKYDDAETTPLSATIKEGDNQIPPFDLEPN